VIGEQLCCYRFPEASCLGCSFQDLDFVKDVLISPAACPFGLGRHWLTDVWPPTELKAQFRGLQALAGDGVLLLRGVKRFVAMPASIVAIVAE